MRSQPLSKDQKGPKAAALQKKQLQVAVSFYIVFAIFVCTVISAIIYVGKRPYEISLNEGDIALRNIYAPFDFIYGIETDDILTRQARFAAMEEVADVFDRDPLLREKMDKNLASYFDDFRLLKEPHEETETTDLPSLAPELKTFLTVRDLEEVYEKTRLFLDELTSASIIDRTLKRELLDRGVRYITVRDEDAITEHTVRLDAVVTTDEISAALDELVGQFFAESRKVRLAVTALTKTILGPTLQYNPTETVRRRKGARAETPNIQRYLEMKKGEVIIRRGQRITRETVDKLNAVNERRSSIDQASLLTGIALPVILMVLLFGMYARIFEPRLFADTKQVAVLGLLLIVGVLCARLVTVSPLPSSTIPTAIPIMLATLLIAPRIAIMLTLILSGLNSLLVGDNFAATMIALAGGLVAVYAIRGARRRSQVLRSGLLVGLTNAALIAAIGLSNNLEMHAWLIEGAWGCVTGIGSAVFVLGILPIFEHAFQITTNISLLELSDLNHPLLRKMMTNAPGTYHHSIVVGNLAEAACEGIGANSLIARVASYFHDIGKTEKAEYFSENQSDAANRHDKLMPTMSNLIIMNHVKNGIELAKKYKLPKSIIDFIAQHHGTSLVFYFYHRALEQSAESRPVMEEEFRYPGPKPQTKETAVVLLADSVEAATRATTDTSHARIKGLVRKVINNKFIDGQLDECDLTLRDLDKIATAFLTVLSGIYHTRVEYPEHNGNEAQAPGEKNANLSKKQSTKSAGSAKGVDKPR